MGECLKRDDVRTKFVRNCEGHAFVCVCVCVCVFIIWHRMTQYLCVDITFLLTWKYCQDNFSIHISILYTINFDVGIYHLFSTLYSSANWMSFQFWKELTNAWSYLWSQYCLHHFPSEMSETFHSVCAIFYHYPETVISVHRYIKTVSSTVRNPSRCALVRQVAII